MFQGFTDSTVDFMWGIRFNNRRDWFQAHRQEYLDSFYAPMRELADELYGQLSDALPGYALNCKVSRIYRDARRLHGGGPYRDHLWLSVQQPSEDYSGTPCFWFELGPEVWSAGLGYYCAKPLTMAKLRARMDADAAPMEKLTRKLNRQSEFTLEGETYRRPRGTAPSPLLEPWYGLKNFSLTHEEKLTEELFSRAIAERLRRDCLFLLPFYRYFAALDGDPDPRES
ncbi:MAG: DUF2461 domain-containing protein [Oscillibacter sp.]|nr:DUF2461 domain-containing protein [Oscillibacter sp.]